MDYVDIELMAVVAAALVVVTLDGRCNRSPRATKYTFPNTTWKNVQASKVWVNTMGLTQSSNRG
jgi:hypothetical protein